MILDIPLMIYGTIFGLIMLIWSYKSNHYLTHWEYGLITLAGIIPVIIGYLYIPRDYYLSIIIMGLTGSFYSLYLDRQRLRKWSTK